MRKDGDLTQNDDEAFKTAIVSNMETGEIQLNDLGKMIVEHSVSNSTWEEWCERTSAESKRKWCEGHAMNLCKSHGQRFGNIEEDTAHTAPQKTGEEERTNETLHRYAAL